MQKWILPFIAGIVFVFSGSHVATATNRTIVVSSVTELIKAIGPNRTIKIRSGTYNITPSKAYQKGRNAGNSHTGLTTKYVTWDQSHDGPQMHIRNVANLQLVGLGKPRILARPRYAWVMRFSNAKNVTLSGLVLGHTPHGGCTGGVVSFERSRNIRIEKSDLFGSGTIGVGLKRVRTFKMVRSTIHDCTYGILQISRSSNVSFERCSFIKNREYDLVEVKQTPSVRFYKCHFRDNYANKSNSFFAIDKRSSVSLDSCTFKNNRFGKMANRPKRLKLTGSSKQVKRMLRRIAPEYNQVYKLLRFRHWIAAGTQGGIVMWNTKTGKPEHIKKAYISSDLVLHAGYLWADTYRGVMRFDGKRWQVKLRTNSRGTKLIKTSAGELLARAGKRMWRYRKIHDVWQKVTRKKAAAFKGYHVITRKNGAIWAIHFMRSITRTQGGKVTRFALRSKAYPARNPRQFHQGADGSLWVVDFGGGFYQYNPKSKQFVRHPSLIRKASDMAIDMEGKRTWLLDYTKGVSMHQKGQKPRFFNLSALKYMRCLFLDTNGDVWIGGWNQIVKIYQENGVWKPRSYIAR